MKSRILVTALSGWLLILTLIITINDPSNYQVRAQTTATQFLYMPAIQSYQTPTPTNTRPPTATRIVLATPTATATATHQPTPGPCICNQGDLYNCSHFATHAQAQACYNYCVSLGFGDVHHLDSDGDGIACESLP